MTAQTMPEQLPLPNLTLPNLSYIDYMAQRARRQTIEAALIKMLGLNVAGYELWKRHYDSPQGQLETLLEIADKRQYVNDAELQDKIKKLKLEVGTKIPFLLSQESIHRALADWFRP